MTQTALTYGSALFDLAQEEGLLEEYMTQLRQIREILGENPEFLTLLQTRSVPLQERLAVLDRCFRGQVSGHLLNYMKILCQNGAAGDLLQSIRQFELCYNRACGILEVRAVSAFPLSGEQEALLAEKLAAVTGKTIRLNCAVDASLLGGIRLILDGTELDGSVRSRLDEVEKKLSALVL